MNTTYALCFADIGPLTAPTTGQAATYGQAVSFVEIPAPASQPIRITAVEFTSDTGTSNDLSPSNTGVFIQMVRATATGTFPNSNLAPQIVNGPSSGNASLVSAAKVKWGVATAEGTVASVNGWKAFEFGSKIGYLYQMPLDREIWIPKGQFFRFRAVGVAGLNLTINVEWEE